MAYEAFTEWMGKSSGNHSIEYILSLDDDEPQLDCYKKQFAEYPIKMLIGKNRSMVDAINTAAEKSTGNVIIVVSDDFGCPDEWDRILGKIELPNVYKYEVTIHPELNDAPEFAIHINDTITTREQGVMTLPILSRSAYEKLGHIYNPVYFSMFADNELYDVCKMNGWLIHSDLIFEHRHWVNGKNPRDETYNRENDTAVYNSGQKIYEARRAAGFK